MTSRLLDRRSNQLSYGALLEDKTLRQLQLLGNDYK